MYDDADDDADDDAYDDAYDDDDHHQHDQVYH